MGSEGSFVDYSETPFLKDKERLEMGVISSAPNRVTIHKIGMGERIVYVKKSLRW